jgi:hypothetical protein
MAAFAPKGDKSLRVIVTELAVAAAYNEVLTFGQLGAALSLDPDDEHDRSRIRQAVGTARPGLLKRHQRALISDRGAGYRVARPGEFAGVADRLREQGEKRFSRALAVIEHAPQADMTPAELHRHRAIGLVIRNLNDRVSNTEQLLADARGRLADLEDAVFGKPPATIQARPEPDGDSAAGLEEAVFRR